MSAVFEDFDDATDLLCDNDGNDTSCDVLDSSFPIREYLVPTLIELIEKEILGTNYRPQDNINNANDDLASLMNFIRNNSKSSLQKAIEN